METGWRSIALDDQLGALAENIKNMRASHGLSLSQLAERSGVAKATLFKIEQGRTNPTLETLSAIALTFDLPVVDLLAMSPKPVVDLVHRGEGTDISDALSVGEVLRSQVIGAGTLEIHSQQFKKGASEVSAPHGAGSREHVLVESGYIMVGPVGHEVKAGPGDYVTYQTDVTHRWQAVDGPAQVWIIHTFPRASAFV